MLCFEMWSRRKQMSGRRVSGTIFVSKEGLLVQGVVQGWVVCERNMLIYNASYLFCFCKIIFFQRKKIILQKKLTMNDKLPRSELTTFMEDLMNTEAEVKGILVSSDDESLECLQGVKSEADITPDLTTEKVYAFNDHVVAMMWLNAAIVVPTQAVYEQIEWRRKKTKDEDALAYYKATHPTSEDEYSDDYVSVTVKIPKNIQECLKKISYFSGLSIKECITALISKENMRLNEYIVENKFNIDPDWFDIGDYYFIQRKK